MPPPSTPAALLAAALAGDPSRPLLTYLDDASGERTELSVVTVDNWVAKTANLLRDGLDVAPGDRVALLLPPHWQGAVWLLACWALGAVAATGPAAVAGAAVVVADGPGQRGLPPGTGAEAVGLALRPLAMPGPGFPAGVLDYDLEVRAHGDRFTPHAPPDPAAPALETADGARTGGELARLAAAAAARWGLGPGDRVLATGGFGTEHGVLAGLLAPLAAGAPVLLGARLDPARLPGHLDRERVSALAAPAGPLPPGGPAPRVLMP